MGVCSAIVTPPDFPDPNIGNQADFFRAAWQPGHGLRSPLLEALAGAYDVTFEIATRRRAAKKSRRHPRQMRTV